MRYLSLGFLLFLLLLPGMAHGLFVDEAETIRFNGRVYNRSAYSVQQAKGNTQIQTPYKSFNMLQNRTFIQLELRHYLTDLVEGNYEGRLSFLKYPLMPLRYLGAEDLSYFVTYRGEYDGVWDYGPDVFSERFPVLADCGSTDKRTRKHPRSNPDCTRLEPRDHLRHRHRLFEAYLDFTKGALFLRVGRQNLSWGETDGFRLLDNINPLDAGFGGFLVSLDERRIPLDMARVVYGFGSIGPFSELNLEAYGALDNEIAEPVSAGSPWGVGGPAGIKSFVKKPARNLTDARGGFRVTGVLGDLTLSAAHYYTFLDTPMVRVMTPETTPSISNRAVTPCPIGDKFCINLADFDRAVTGGEENGTSKYLVDNFVANLFYPKIAISGATASFSVPSLYTVVRSEVAIFWREPFFKNSHFRNLIGPVDSGGQITPGFRQIGVDPETGSPLLTYKNDIDRSNVVRWSLGLDVNRYIRFLNPQQSFIISGQIFGTHIVDFDNSALDLVNSPYDFAHFSTGVADPNRGNAVTINMDQHQLVNTLLVSTSFRSGLVVPRLILFYDWQGSVLVQPEITFIRDPFRFILQYNYLDGQYNGIGFLRDRDNLIFQMELVL